MAAEQGLAVDEVGFRQLMAEQRQRAKADAPAKKGQHADTTAYREIADRMGRPVTFTGYDEVVSEATVTGLVTEGGVGRPGRGGRDRRARARPDARSTPRAVDSTPTRA